MLRKTTDGNECGRIKTTNIQLTVISRGRVGYDISYPTSASGIIVLLKMPTKSR